MNSPVSAGEDSISDVVQVLSGPNAAAWDTVFFGYIGDRSCLKLRRRIPPWHPWWLSSTQQVAFRVQDYAAEAEISIHAAGLGCRTLDVTQHVPAHLPYFVGITDSMKAADPDSDGLTRWEEYRGFCNMDDSHFRLDADTTLARKQIILIDQDGLFESQDWEDLLPRFSEMMRANLLVSEDLSIDALEQTCGPLWSWSQQDRIDTRQAVWSADSSMWFPNNLTDPKYSIGAPINWDGYERPIEQVAVRLSSIPLADMGDVFALACHNYGNPPEWGYGICGNAGIAYDFENQSQYLLRIWPRLAMLASLWNDVKCVSLPRTIAHELGHAINVPDHHEEWEGSNYQCVMLCDPLWANRYFDRNLSESMAIVWWQNAFIHNFQDHPSDPDLADKWGYHNDGSFHCADSICFRPPFRTP